MIKKILLASMLLPLFTSASADVADSRLAVVYAKNATEKDYKVEYLNGVGPNYHSYYYGDGYIIHTLSGGVYVRYTGLKSKKTCLITYVPRYNADNYWRPGGKAWNPDGQGNTPSGSLCPDAPVYSFSNASVYLTDN